MHQDFIENRKKLLGYFIKSLTKYNYLLISEEFQMFLRGPADFHKTSFSRRNVTYPQISQKYSKVFEVYAFYDRTPETEKEIGELKSFFELGKGVIEKLEHVCETNQQVFKQIDNGTIRIMGAIKDLTNFYGEKVLEVTTRPAAADPYADLLDWCKTNLLEIKGILEGIGRRGDLEKAKLVTLNNIEEQKRNISKRQSGKKKLIQYFNKKSNEYYISQSENEIQNLVQNVAALDSILNVSAAMILKDEYPEFKSRKIFTLGVVVDISAEKSHQEIESIVAQLKELEAKI